MDEILAEDLIKQDEDICHKQTIIYEEVLKKCFAKIKITNNIKKQKECLFDIPPIIYGHPRFDIEACIIFLTIKLKKNGFKVKKKSDNQIKISWKPKPTDKKSEIKQQIKNIELLKQKELENSNKNKSTNKSTDKSTDKSSDKKKKKTIIYAFQ